MDICGKKNIGNYDCLQEKYVGSPGILCFYGKILEETMANGKIYETFFLRDQPEDAGRTLDGIDDAEFPSFLDALTMRTLFLGGCFKWENL